MCSSVIYTTSFFTTKLYIHNGKGFAIYLGIYFFFFHKFLPRTLCFNFQDAHLEINYFVYNNNYQILDGKDPLNWPSLVKVKKLKQKIK